MIGTTRSRVSFFMNRFRKLGFIDYSGRIRVHKSLLNIVLHDQLPKDNAEKQDSATAAFNRPRGRRPSSSLRNGGQK
jgi:CRP/FNR family transcriptional regulator, cyclic AMP receptor protein